MNKVLLVDDEPAIRAGLRTLVDWAKYGFEVVGDAANGREALLRHQALAPDLIVIDIRMPGMDGLQVLEEVRRTDARCRFIILSGYADFSYAQTAIGLGVHAYLLKPVDEEEMEAELDRLSQLLAEESRWTEAGGQAAARRPEEVLQAALFGSTPDWEQLGAELAACVPGAGGPCQILLLDLEPAGGAEPPASTAAKREAGRRIEELGLGCVFAVEPQLGILLTQPVPAAGSRGRQELLEQLRGAAAPLRFTAAAGAAVHALPDIRQSYQTAYTVMKRRFLLTRGEIHSDLPEAVRPPASVSASSEPAAPDLTELAQSLFYVLDLGDVQGVGELLERAGSELIRSGGSENEIKTGFVQIATTALNKLSAVQGNLNVQEYIPGITELYRMTSYEELLRELSATLMALASRLGSGGSEPVLKRLVSFIRKHYCENLKLETLAELFGYNSGYLGKVFKQHTGESFNTYLDKLRIEHAMEFLRQGFKVHQVSEKVGYANVDYFHIKFKKYVGVSPSSFKGGAARTAVLRDGAEG